MLRQVSSLNTNVVKFVTKIDLSLHKRYDNNVLRFKTNFMREFYTVF